MFVGGGAMYLNDAIGKAGIDYICMHHEQALTMAAEAYARITGRPSVCIVTTGPGGINALNGVAGAWLDSIPMIVISGQVRLPMMRTGTLRQMGDQELPIVDIVKPITKMAEVVTKVEDVAYLLAKAENVSKTGRPGPVWLDIPMDIQGAEYPNQVHIIVSKEYYEDPVDSNLENIVRRIDAAKRPVIIAGNGIRLSHAYTTFLRFLEKTKIPVALSFDAKDLLSTDHPQNLGIFGTIGQQKTNDIIQEADLLLILGCRMNVRQTGYNFGELGKNAVKIMVDIDRDELNKYIFIPDYTVCLDIGRFLYYMNTTVNHENWLLAAKPPTASSIWMWDTDSKRFSLKHVMQSLSIQIKDQQNVIVSTNGMASVYSARYLSIAEGDRYIVNSGLSSMGYGLPAAIGAALASQKRTICFEGDGSLQLNIQELQTLKYLNLPVKVFVVNNEGYSSIKRTQDNYFQGNYVGCTEKTGVSFPSLRRIAEAYQLPYVNLCTYTDCDRRIKEVLDQSGPVICEVQADPNEIPYKAVYKGGKG